jgi:hypothetical protein
VLPSYCTPGHVTILACNRTWPSPLRYHAFSHNCLPEFEAILRGFVYESGAEKAEVVEARAVEASPSGDGLALIMTTTPKVKLGLRIELITQLRGGRRGTDDRLAKR